MLNGYKIMQKVTTKLKCINIKKTLVYRIHALKQYDSYYLNQNLSSQWLRLYPRIRELIEKKKVNIAWLPLASFLSALS